MARARQASHLMRRILVSLRCEEGLEVERMIQDMAGEPGTEVLEAEMEELEPQDGATELNVGATTQLSLWRQVQSYLVVEQTIERLEDQSTDEARVVVTVHNAAPDSRDWPSVHFRSVEIRVPVSALERGHSGQRELGEIAPGDTRQVEFKYPVRQLISFEVEISGEIDTEKLFRFTRTQNPPHEIIEPLRREFLDKLESIDVKEVVNSVLEQVDAPISTMTLSDIARVREALQRESERIEGKRDEVVKLFEDFKLGRQSTLGARTREIILALDEFRQKLQVLDKAMSSTDMEMINEALSNLKQIHLAVLRVEDVARAATSGV